MITRNDIITEARSWIGTRFHHQGRVKKTAKHDGGCDCIGLVVGVVRDLGLRDAAGGKLLCEYDTTNYARLPDGQMLKDSLGNCLQEIDFLQVQAGDVLLFKFEKDPQHVAIVSDYPGGDFGIIHCYASSRRVVENRLDDTWRSRVVGAYRFFGV